MPKTKVHKTRENCPPHLRVRLRDLRKRIRQWGADALLINRNKDIRYLTGFIGDDSWLIVPAGASKVTVISDFRFQEEIQREAPHVSVKMRQGGLTQELKKLATQKGYRRIAFQANHITVAGHKILAKAIGVKNLMPVDDGLLAQRAVKDDTEIRAIRRALKIQQEAFRRTVEQIEPGQSEQQIAAHLEYQMRMLGADGCAFPTIVAVGANASLPHAIPGSRKVKKGQIILIDWGAVWNGYCSDLTRVVAVGAMSAKMREVYRIVLEAQRAAIDAIAPGKLLSDIDATARRVIEKAGYGDRFGHSLGHGLGLDVHEQPTLASKSKGQLVPGQVVTVEPGIYLPGIGGVRIEDDVLVTARGRRVLSDLPTGLESTII